MEAKVKVIGINQPIDWNIELEIVGAADFYHSFSYNSYYSNLEGKSILYCFQKDNYDILFPLILRKTAYNEYFDVTSVYGYAGPLCSHSEVPAEVVSEFTDSLNKFFAENNIVSAFCRLHPSFHNELLLEGLGDVLPLSETVYIDLTLPLDEQKKKYRKGVKSDLSKLAREGFSVFEDADKKYIHEFIEIYNENMIRVSAKPEYFFNEEYYKMIFNSPDINSKLFFVVKDNVKVAASIFVFTGDIIQYHLSSTRGDYLRNSPVRLIIDHMRIYGTENGYKELHLGGGVGSSADSLFQFKAGFSDCRHQFKVWRHIVNPEIYNQLVRDHKASPNSNYFPLYRAPR